MTDHTEHRQRDQTGHRQRQIDPGQHTKITDTVQQCRFPYFIGNPPEEIQQHDHIEYGNRAGDHDRPQRIDHSQPGDQNVGRDQSACKEHGDHHEHHVKFPSGKIVFIQRHRVSGQNGQYHRNDRTQQYAQQTERHTAQHGSIRQGFLVCFQ